jgi:hypothetical protein
MVLYIFFFPENINLWGEKVQFPLTLVETRAFHEVLDCFFNFFKEYK